MVAFDRLLGVATTPTQAFPQPAVTVGTSRVAITASAVPCAAVTVKSAAANTGKIWLGDSTVTNGGGGNVEAELLPCEGVSFDIGTTGGLYVVSDTASQKVFVGVVG